MVGLSYTEWTRKDSEDVILEQGSKGMEVSKPGYYLREKYCRWKDQLQRPLRKEHV